ncbi:MAG: hypothetical protein AAGA65_24480 [Actinomycetota bacterium]
MDGFDYSSSPIAVRDDILESHRTAWALLAEPGTWFTGVERLAIAARARTMFAARATPPWARTTEPAAGVSEATAEVVDLVTLDAGSIDRAKADAAIAAIGEGPYVELIGIVAVTVMVDVFAEAMGLDPEPFPEPIDGEPARTEPDGLGDIGAHVRALDPFPAANVARALSLVPDANTLFRTVSVPAYSSPGFADLQWETPLSRPQVELVASRVAALNECFY